MEYTYPYYYKQFKCTAHQCSDTCCAGWQIAIDKKTLKKYKKEKGPFGNRLYNSVDWPEGTFLQYDHKRCAFLNEQNLCDICLEAGEEYLCKTCRRYPRHYEEFENLREISLSLSCPEAARLILGTKRPISFKTREQESDTEEYDVFDFFLFTKLQEIREFLFETIRREDMSFEIKTALMLAAVHDLQNRLSRQELFAVDDLLKRYRQPDFPEKIQKKWRRYENRGEVRCYLMHGMMYRLHQLEVLDPEWESWLKKCEGLLYEETPPGIYISRREEFCTAYADRNYEYERLLEYFIFSYFCGAVYDGNAFGKLKLAVVHTLLIRELNLASWMIKKEAYSFEDQIEISHRYAREIEHSDLNLHKIDKMMSEDPFFDLDHLLVCTLG
ncbi:Flagellar biosynthetic protein fliU [uncultured Roseburia sp.]|uniref:Flagellin lysine-N-methylase n=1 Tax=Brotonthovivens ammoniilytica TaxID=2981725 RepID=A0ABT2TN67_9FIRM|nr:flagellin lysine-N-methylase [Brotonthovivens ammoniilytica]MCU6763663.1 flagellin lysine-N-methylase [Brotonthovivens ammoniilytica]SCJ29850.1 Flagellar biosynthetic protein fliU [uncultured Roseburia sp.]